MVPIERRGVIVVMSLLGASLVVVACASPTEADTAELPAPVEPEECVEPATLSKTVGRERCNYGNSWHCMAAQQGWVWVALDRRPRPGPASGVEDPPAGTGYRCCIRVGPAEPPRPQGT